MSFPYEDWVKNDQADGDAARVAVVSLHTGPPGHTGANEATGGSPAYARVSPSFAAAGVEGPLGPSQPASVGVAWGECTFDLPAGDYTHYGYRDAGGVWVGGDVLPSTVSLGAQGSQQISIAIGPEA